MFGIIIFGIWYLTIGTIIMLWTFNNSKQEWEKAIDMLIESNYQLKFYERDFIEGACTMFIILTWMIWGFKSLIAKIRIKLKLWR